MKRTEEEEKKRKRRAYKIHQIAEEKTKRLNK